jgi:hypothetical protein
LGPKLSRRSVLVGTAATAVQLVFRTKLSAASALAAAPGLVDLCLTALTGIALRIGIAPATAQPSTNELGLVDQNWPVPLEPPAAATPHIVAWGKYTVHVEVNPLIITISEGENKRQQIRFDLDSTNVHFLLDGPVFGLGEGTNTFDRRNTREGLVNGQTPADFRTYSARLQIPFANSAAGWGIFIGQPQGTFEFTQTEGIFRGAEAT